MINLNNLNKYREGNRLEAKKAAGGLPNSLWATYSSFANTNGGMILLGVEETNDKSLVAVGVDSPEKLISDFWNTVNSSQKVSLNILLDKHVRIENVDGKRIVIIEVPRADRAFKPVFLNEKPYAETYRRNGEGDYRCTREVVEAMIRDKGDRTQDMLVLLKMPLTVFDYDSLHRYRNRMKVTRPGHVWEELDDVEFLQKLGAIGIGEDDKWHPTAAGLLMFGSEYEIVREYPQYFLDYQEHFDADVRWTDRITSSSGEWSGNVFDFFYKTYNKLIQNPNIKIPFKMESGRDRIDDTPVHKALREALANCLINADFYGTRGIVIRNNLDGIIMENPGDFRVSFNEALSGGVSSPRNSVIIKMFNLLDIGERSGSGVPLIYHAWKEQEWNEPTYTEQFEPDRTILRLLIKAQIKAPNKTRLKRNDSNDSFALIEKSILEYLSEHPGATQIELAAAIGKSRSAVQDSIALLKEKGLLDREGAKKNGRWIVKTEYT
ncbi:MAG: putative DNA binding domain-containing protein [Chitinispirillales bacterium]|jgi:predicted HTH transcriptional regulator|nr:putative DNA binding domain-containing protein [Chitinispirillales bacterium]